jgi:flagellar basal body-associated protein FliL
MNFLERLKKLPEGQKKIIIWIIIIILAIGLFYWSYQNFKNGFAKIKQQSIEEQFNARDIQEHSPKI